MKVWPWVFALVLLASSAFAQSTHHDQNQAYYLDRMNIYGIVQTEEDRAGIIKVTEDSRFAGRVVFSGRSGDAYLMLAGEKDGIRVFMARFASEKNLLGVSGERHIPVARIRELADLLTRGGHMVLPREPVNDNLVVELGSEIEKGGNLFYVRDNLEAFLRSGRELQDQPFIIRYRIDQEQLTRLRKAVNRLVAAEDKRNPPVVSDEGMFVSP